MKKPVIRSPLDRLPLHQVQALLAWITTGGPDGLGIPYREAQKRLADEFGVKISTSGLHAFYHRHRKAQALPPKTTFDPVTNTLTIVIQLPR